jgi:predicted transcriptional regulator
VSAKEVARIERGEVDPRDGTIKKLAKALQVQPGEILTY